MEKITFDKVNNLMDIVKGVKIMTKDKFLNLLDDELKELKHESQIADARFQLFIKTGASEEAIGDAVHTSYVTSKKLDNLRGLLKTPIIARIESASDVEVEDYRQSQVKIIESFITHYKEYLETTKTKIKNKEKEREEVIKQYSKANELNSKDLMRKLEADAWRIQNELADLEENMALYQDKLELGELELEELKDKSIKEIKREQLLKVADSDSIKRKHEFDNRPRVSKAMRLIYSVTEDDEKSKKMMKLLSEYNKLSGNKHRVALEISRPEDISLPKEFWSGVDKKWWSTISDDYSKILIHDADSFLNYVRNVRKKYDEETKFFEEHFTEEKLKDLPKYRHMDTSFERREWVENLDKAIEFLELHSDKISKEDFKNFKMKVEEYNEIKKKFFKTKKVREEQQILINEIYNSFNSLVNAIYWWYCDEGNKVIDILRVDFETSYRGLIFSICDGHMDYIREDQQRELGRLQYELSQAAITISEEKKSYDPRMKELRKQIIELAGPEWAGTDLSPITEKYRNYPGNETLTDITIRMQEEELYKKIYDAVREDVVKTESELTHKTKEQLREEKIAAIKRRKALENAPRDVNGVPIMETKTVQGIHSGGVVLVLENKNNQ